MSATDMDMKAVRKQLGLTQVELGAIVYLTPRQLSKIESGRAKVPPLVAEKLLRLTENFRA